LDLRRRAEIFARLDGQQFDLVVIGGGVTGAGVARDAAQRGLSVLLVEARDFASGASSRSSKMIHGGLRYMAQGDLGLVSEAATERKAVERIAPHLTRQTPFVIPAKNAAVIAKLRTGMWAFEKLGAVPKDRRHEVWDREALAEKEPSLRRDDLFGAVVYPEYLTDDARLTLANIRSAVADGAEALNYAPVTRVIVEGGRATGVEIGDGLGDGASRAAVRARVLVNAAGPWVDALRALEASSAPTRLSLTKGVHLVTPRARLPVERTVIYPAADRRSVFAVPKGPVTYIGTTDTFHPKAEHWPEITGDDVHYLLAATNARFDVVPLTPGDMVSAWSGLRPLVAQDGKSASEISRKDEVWTGPGGVLSIAGGKLTAYRRMAERIVDLAEEALGRRPTACRTAETPLQGGDVDVPAARRACGSDGDRLVGLYGSDAPELAAAGGGPAVEARHAVLSEGAVTLEDYWVRRSARAWFDTDGGVAALPVAAEAMAPLLGWSEAETARQITACMMLRTGLMTAMETA
jgi:glycerol-3-phosphate dehydrogenase